MVNAWMTFNQGQTIVNVRHIVSARVSGKEDKCQVVFKDTNGDEYNSEYCQSFDQAKKVIDKFIEETFE